MYICILHTALKAQTQSTNIKDVTKKHLSMSLLLIQLILNALPVILAAILHMIVVRKGWFKKWMLPLDGGRMYRGHRIFGENKTIRGLVVMLLASILFTWIYYAFLLEYQSLEKYNLLNFQQFGPTIYGLIFGLGYILGELPNSFIKRQKNIPPGHSPLGLFRLIDQLDSVVFILLILVFFSSFTWKHFCIGVVFYGAIHLGINYLLYLIGIRKEAF